MQPLQSMYMLILMLPFWVGFSFVDLLCMSSITRKPWISRCSYSEEATLNWTVLWGGIHMIWQTPHWYQHADANVVFVHHYFLEKELLFFIHIYVVLHYYTRRGTASQGLPNRPVPGCILAGTLRFHACNAYSSKSTLWLLMVGIQQQYKCLKQPRWWNWLWRHQSPFIISSKSKTPYTQTPFLNRAKLWLPFRVGRAPIVHSVK